MHSSIHLSLHKCQKQQQKIFRMLKRFSWATRCREAQEISVYPNTKPDEHTLVIHIFSKK